MSAPLFFVDSLEGQEASLSGTDTRHALRSLRMRAGDEVSLSDGKGFVARGVLTGDRDGRATVRIGEVSAAIRPRPEVSVGLAAPKGERLSWAVQKLGELGVDELLLMRTRRSVRETPSDRTEQRRSRLRSVAREAAMQSRRPFVMDIRPDESLEESVEAGDSAVVMMAPQGKRGLESLVPADAAAVRILVGPEGGWSEEETALAVRRGATLWSLGEGILRTETAAVVGAALVLARYGRLG